MLGNVTNEETQVRLLWSRYEKKTVVWKRTVYEDMTMEKDMTEDKEKDGFKISRTGPD